MKEEHRRKERHEKGRERQKQKEKKKKGLRNRPQASGYKTPQLDIIFQFHRFIYRGNQEIKIISA